MSTNTMGQTARLTKTESVWSLITAHRCSRLDVYRRRLRRSSAKLTSYDRSKNPKPSGRRSSRRLCSGQLSCISNWMRRMSRSGSCAGQKVRSRWCSQFPSRSVKCSSVNGSSRRSRRRSASKINGERLPCSASRRQTRRWQATFERNNLTILSHKLLTTF